MGAGVCNPRFRVGVEEGDKDVPPPGVEEMVLLWIEKMAPFFLSIANNSHFRIDRAKIIRRFAQERERKEQGVG